MTIDATGQCPTAPPDSGAALKPQAPHDALSFEELGRRYNLLKVSSYVPVLTNLIVGEIRTRSRHTQVLDVGCGRGIEREPKYQWAIRDAADEFWGVEPDEEAPATPGLFDHYQHAMMETAQLPENTFDIAYSSMVMEHLADPEAFMKAIYRCLRPGGVYLFVTPNGRSLVVRVARALRTIHLAETVLRLVKGKQQVDDYHYPVQYRFNTPEVIDHITRCIGFRKPEYVFLQGHGMKGYFPGVLRPIYHLLVLKQKIVRNPRRLATMICRVIKPNGAEEPRALDSPSDRPDEPD